jgi:hypothetical protein
MQQEKGRKANEFAKALSSWKQPHVFPEKPTNYEKVKSKIILKL